jgi:ferritin-like metal-binding protein YciE
MTLPSAQGETKEMEDSRERIVRYLQDAHAAEVGIKEALEGFVDDTDDPTIKQAFQQHITMTQSQADRLEQRLLAYNETPSGGKGFFNSLMAKMGELMHGAHDEFDKNTQNLIKAYATEHLERGMYESLIAYATAIGDNDTAQIARQIQMEEEQTGQMLFPMIAQYAQTALANTSDAGVNTSGDRAYPL